MRILTIPAVAYSNAALLRCDEAGINISPLKLQKLIYLSYAMRLSHNRSLIDELVFEAWNYGPVISAIYDSYKSYGSQIIRNYLSLDGKWHFLDKEHQSDVDEAVLKYGRLPGYSLIDVVHHENGAWKLAYIKGRNIEIDHEDIREEFQNS